MGWENCGLRISKCGFVLSWPSEKASSNSIGDSQSEIAGDGRIADCEFRIADLCA